MPRYIIDSVNNNFTYFKSDNIPNNLKMQCNFIGAVPNVCHIIAVDTIYYIMTQALNLNKLTAIEYLIDAIYPIAYGYEEQNLKCKNANLTNLEEINELCDFLSSSCFNLKIGDARWNQSIGNCYDSFVPIDFNNDRFEVKSITDCYRISILKKIIESIGDEYDNILSIYSGFYKDRFFAYSSSNNFKLPLVKDVKEVFNIDFIYTDFFTNTKNKIF